MITNPKTLRDIINNNKGKRVNAVKVINNTGNAISILPKLIADKNNIKNFTEENINLGSMLNLSEQIRSKEKNNEYILDLFPDLRLSMQILTSSIISPKKMTDPNLNYRFNKNSFFKDPKITSELLDCIINEIDDVYHLKDNLVDMLSESLFNSGAYVYLIVPESSLDDIINSDIKKNISQENLNIINKNIVKTKGIFTEYDITIEDNSVNNFIKSEIEKLLVHNKITDNIDVIKIPKIKEKLTKYTVENLIKNKNTNISVESINYLDIFRSKNENDSYYNKIIELKVKNEASRLSIGRPMAIKVNTSSIIPVFRPGDSKNHIGYFLLVNEFGLPINTISENYEYLKDPSKTDNNQNYANNNLIIKAYNNLLSNNYNYSLTDLYNNYKNIIENNLYKKIKKSIYGEDIKFSDYNDIYYTMFIRSITKQNTALVYIPEELVCYIAFNYNDNGTGKSLLDSLSIISSLRAITLFSKVMSYSKTAIDVTKINVVFDPNDPDPNKTFEIIADTAMKTRLNMLPLFTTNPVELVDRLQRAGLMFSYENHPGMPNTKIEFDNTPMQHTIPDTTLEDDLRKQMIMSFGLNPEMVDNSFSPDFATSVINNNIMLSKRVMEYQNKFIPHLNKFIRLIIENDEILRGKLKKTIEKNISTITTIVDQNLSNLYKEDKEKFYDIIIDYIKDDIECSLPSPDITNISNLSSDFDQYKDSLIKVIDSFISQEVLPSDMAGDLSTHIDTIKAAYIHHLLRKWMSENGYMTELLEITNEDKVNNNTNPTNSSIGNYLINLLSKSTELFNIMTKPKEAVNQDLSTIKLDESSASMTTSYSNSNNEENNDNNNEEEDFGEDDINLDL